MTLTQDEIKERFKSSMERLRSEDSILFNKNVNERTITHKLAEYLQEEFPDYNVDCEYNRYEDLSKKIKPPKDEVKWTDTEGKSIFPDIVVHKRGNQDNNLLIMEVKKSSNRINGEFDKTKIKALMKKPYKYKCGLYLELDIDGEEDEYYWYFEDNPR